MRGKRQKGEKEKGTAAGVSIHMQEQIKLGRLK